MQRRPVPVRARQDSNVCEILTPCDYTDRGIARLRGEVDPQRRVHQRITADCRRVLARWTEPGSRAKRKCQRLSWGAPSRACGLRVLASLSVLRTVHLATS